MSKNTKKKNAIRFGAIAVAALLFLGVFSAWALSTQATATAETGDIIEDEISVTLGANVGEELLEDSVAGRPGSVSTPYELYNIDDTDALEGAPYTAIVYITNGADLMDAGLRYMTLDVELQDDTGEIVTFDGEDQEATFTLENGRVAFNFNEGDLGGAGDIIIDGGTYGSHPFADLTDTQVEFLIDVEPGVPNDV